MSNPYKKHLTSLKEREATDVTIHRHGATDITGAIKKVDENGCIIANTKGETETSTFVAHRDIRGVATSGWDMDLIAN